MNPPGHGCGVIRLRSAEATERTGPGFTKVLWGIMEMMSQGWAFSGTTAAFTQCWLSTAMVPTGPDVGTLIRHDTHTAIIRTRLKDWQGELGVMSLRDSQTETWRHSDVTVSGLGPLAKP